MKFKKLGCLALAGIMIMSLLAGCGKEAKKEEAATTKSPDGKEMVGNMYKTGLPIVKDKATIKMIGVQGPQTGKFDDMPFFKQLEEKTNVHIEWELYPQSGYAEKKNMILAANDLPEAFFGPSAFSMDDANKYGPMGTVIPLDDLIEKYAPKYKEALKKKPLMGGLSTSFDGKKYTMGTVTEQDARSYPDNLYINKTWLDKLGLKVPTTLDEYYEVLKAFKEKDPNGNGKKDEIPFTFTNFNHINGYGSFFGAFGRIEAFNGNFTAPDKYDHFVVENGKVVFTADKNEYKDAVKYLSKFFKDELFDKEGITQDAKQYQAKMKDPNGLVGSFYGWGVSGQVAPERAKDYVAIAPLKGPSGKDPYVKRRNNHINILGQGFTITSTNKNPEITIRWVDEFYDPKTSLEAQYGPVGTGLKDAGNGTFDYVKEAPQGVSYLDMWHKYAPFDQSPKFIPVDTWGKTLPVNENDKEKADVIAKYYSNAKNINDTLPMMNFKAEELKTISSVGLDVGNLVREKQVKWLLNGGIDAEWDAYVAKLNQLKLDEFVKLMQTVYERTSGTKK